MSKYVFDKSREHVKVRTCFKTALTVHVNHPFSPQDEDSNSLTTDNVERHRQLSQAPVLPDGGALLSEAKLQSIMSFLDEMEKSEQERPRSVTSGSHREVNSDDFHFDLVSMQMFICFCLCLCRLFCQRRIWQL